jgi:O-antigen/teichoic acid export membrane protein
VSIATRVREWLQRTFAGGRFARHLALLAGGTAIAQASSVLVAPILTRLYVPADLGAFGVFSAFVATAAIITCARYDVAVVSARDRGDAARLTIIALVLSVPLTALVTSVLAILIRYRVLGFGTLPPAAIAIAGPAVLMTSCFTALRYWYLREESFGLLSKIAIYQGVARSVAQVLFGFFGLSAIGLLAGDVVGRIAGVGRMLRDAIAPLRAEIEPRRAGSFAETMVRYREFPQFSLPSSLVDTMALQIPVPLFALLYGAGPAGEFTLVQRLLAAPMALISIAVADAFHGRVARYMRTQPQVVRRFFLRTGRLLFLTGAGPMALAAIAGPITFGWIFGAKWAGVGLLAAILAPAALAQLSVSPLTRIVFLLPRGLRLKLLLDIGALAMVLGIVFGCHRFGLSFARTLICYCAGQVLYFGLYFLLMLRFLPPSEGAH